MTRYRYPYRRSTVSGKVGLFAGAAVVAALVTQSHPARGHTADAAGMAVPAHYSSNEQLANDMAASGYHWTGRQRSCLDWLWTRESGFQTTAVNGQTGATGIPQLNPAYHAIPAGWPRAQVQVRWGLGYIHGTYGSPCAAWSHEEAVSWY